MRAIHNTTPYSYFVIPDRYHSLITFLCHGKYSVHEITHVLIY